MSKIEYKLEIEAPDDILFDLTQDYGKRAAWDPFADHYEFEGGTAEAAKGVRFTVFAKNGQKMKVEYVSYNRPRAAAIRMIEGPWFIGKFAGTWQFQRISENRTTVSFVYNVEPCKGLIGHVVKPFLIASFNRHTRKRLHALRKYCQEKLSR